MSLERAVEKGQMSPAAVPEMYGWRHSEDCKCWLNALEGLLHRFGSDFQSVTNHLNWFSTTVTPVTPVTQNCNLLV